MKPVYSANSTVKLIIPKYWNILCEVVTNAHNLTSTTCKFVYDVHLELQKKKKNVQHIAWLCKGQ